MKTLADSHILQEEINLLKRQGRTIGFVPTMGALHQGHLSLIREAGKHCDTVVCSIFVNPTQFNQKSDFDRYPRVLQEDLGLLETVDCSIVFTPTEKTIYPDDTHKLNIDFGYLETVLEGKFRPGHFKGVGMVVKRLFECVQPHKAFFGLKDYQQYLVIKELQKKYFPGMEIIGLPTIREKDGLAMSSRNRLLSEEEHQQALLLSQLLNYCKENYSRFSIGELKQYALEKMKENSLLQPEYFEFADGETLKILNNKNESKNPVALVAAFAGKVRLIDNMKM
ncbi:MAG: pantoate--beta-alanine ligase [Bacteroidota bacterium]